MQKRKWKENGISTNRKQIMGREKEGKEGKKRGRRGRKPDRYTTEGKGRGKKEIGRKGGGKEEGRARGEREREKGE